MIQMTSQDYLKSDYDARLAFGSLVWFDQPERTPIYRAELRTHIQFINRYGGGIPVKLIDHECLCGLLGRDFPEPFLGILQCSSEQIKNDKTIQQGFAVIHDDHEAIVGDVSSGLKKHLSSFRDIEHRWEIWVHKQQGMSLEHRNHGYVKALDIASLVCEMKAAHHSARDYAPEKYKVAWTPAMGELAHQVIFEMNNDEKWDIIQSIYLAGKTRLEELLGDKNGR